MFEEISANAGQLLVTLFWTSLILLFLWGALWAKTPPKPD